jgi:hypothetical protein
LIYPMRFLIQEPDSKPVGLFMSSTDAVGKFEPD